MIPLADDDALDRLILTHLQGGGPRSTLDPLAFSKIVAAKQIGTTFTSARIHVRLEAILAMNLRELGRLRARVFD